MDTLSQIKIRLNQLRAELTAMESRRTILTTVIQELQDVADSLESEKPAPAPAPKPRQPRGAVEALVLKALDGGFYATIEDLVAATAQKPNSIRAALKALMEQGKVREPVKGKWTNMEEKKAETKAKPADWPLTGEPAVPVAS